MKKRRSGGGGGGSAPPRPRAPGYHLPLTCGASALVVQGPGGAYSHGTTQSLHAYDFDLPNGTPLVAVEDGTVKRVRGDVGPGDACWSGGGYGCRNTVNYVVVEHGDGTDSIYLHLSRPLVAVGQRVRRGDRVGLSGGTGWSTGPHAHVARQRRCSSWICDSVAMTFAEAGVPKTGQRVTSRNCP